MPKWYLKALVYVGQRDNHLPKQARRWASVFCFVCKIQRWKWARITNNVSVVKMLRVVGPFLASRPPKRKGGGKGLVSHGLRPSIIQNFRPDFPALVSISQNIGRARIRICERVPFPVSENQTFLSRRSCFDPPNPILGARISFPGLLRLEFKL